MQYGTWADDDEVRHRLPPLHRPSNSVSDDSCGYGQFDNRYDEDYFENEDISSDFSSGRGGYPLLLTTNSLSNIVFQNNEPDNEKYQKMLLNKQKRYEYKTTCLIRKLILCSVANELNTRQMSCVVYAFEITCKLRNTG